MWQQHDGREGRGARQQTEGETAVRGPIHIKASDDALLIAAATMLAADPNVVRVETGSNDEPQFAFA